MKILDVYFYCQECAQYNSEAFVKPFFHRRTVQFETLNDALQHIEWTDHKLTVRTEIEGNEEDE